MAEEDDLDVGAGGASSGGKKKIIIIAVALLLILGGGGAAAYLFLFSGSESDEPVAEQGESIPANAPSLYEKLDSPFVIDFLVNGTQRYLQINVALKTKSATQMDAVKLHMPLIRNSLVLLFSSQTFDELKTVKGKEALKKAALDAVNGILERETGQGGVDAVLFTNFVMQ